MRRHYPFLALRGTGPAHNAKCIYSITKSLKSTFPAVLKRPCPNSLPRPRTNLAVSFYNRTRKQKTKNSRSKNK
jgi:hypothetical protein